MVEDLEVDITAGRHPVIDLLLDGGQYVANDTKLSVSKTICWFVNYCVRFPLYETLCIVRNFEFIVWSNGPAALPGEYM